MDVHRLNIVYKNNPKRFSIEVLKVSRKEAFFIEFIFSTSQKKKAIHDIYFIENDK